MEEKEKDIEKERQERRRLLDRSSTVLDEEGMELRESARKAYERLKKEGFFETT